MNLTGCTRLFSVGGPVGCEEGERAEEPKVEAQREDVLVAKGQKRV